MLTIREMQPDDWQALANIRDSPPTLFRQYQDEHTEGLRTVLVAEVDGRREGYLIIEWTSSHPLFRAEGIPEIAEMRFEDEPLPPAIAEALLGEAEKRASVAASAIGIAVSLIPENGPMPPLLIARGYLPDERGISWRGAYVDFGDHVVVDNRLALPWRKALHPNEDPV